MVTPDQMVEVGGVRYRPEDAPKKAPTPAVEVEQKEAPVPRNKARRVTDK